MRGALKSPLWYAEAGRLRVLAREGATEPVSHSDQRIGIHGDFAAEKLSDPVRAPQHRTVLPPRAPSPVFAAHQIGQEGPNEDAPTSLSSRNAVTQD
jgi:hypothetical protein